MTKVGNNHLKIKMLQYFLFCLISIFTLSTSYARPSQSIILTKETISSLHRCPLPNRNAVQLRCRSYHQTTHYTCGPAVAMALMNYYGKLSNKDMNHATEMRIASEMGTTEAGTSPGQVATWLRNHNFQVDSGQRVSTDMLIENIQRGAPTIIAFRNHWVLAKGYRKGATPAEDEIIFSDSCCNISIMTRNDIDSMWQRAQMPSNHCAEDVGIYIAAVPKN